MRKSWTAARYDCVQDGGDLVSITTAEEQQYVVGSEEASTFLPIDLWIGLSTLVRGNLWSSCYLILSHMVVVSVSVTMSFVSPEMQQDLMSG